MKRLLGLSRLCGSIALAAALLLSVSSRAAAEGWRFAVKFSEIVHKEPFSGRFSLFVNTGTEPRLASNWFNPGQFIARDVHDWKPGEPLEFSSTDKSILSFPEPAARLKLARQSAQAVVRFNPF